MKRLVIYVVAVLFGVISFTSASAQPGRGHGKWDRRGHPKHRHERQKAAHEYARERGKAEREYYREREKSYREYYRDRDKAYRKYIKNRGRRYRDHDAWYYGRKFHRRTEYVYFPAYRTYYDPYRRGYVYWHNNAWIFDQTMPAFMMGLNLGAVNVQFMANLPL